MPNLNLKRDLQKIPRSVATMSLLTKRVYLRLCTENYEKKNSGSEGLRLFFKLRLSTDKLDLNKILCFQVG